MNRFPFYGLTLADTGVDGLIAWLVEEPAGSFRCAGYLNAHTFNLATERASKLAPLLRQFDVIYPDGMAVVWAARRQGRHVSERVSAADFLPRFCDAAQRAGRRIALVGGRPGLAAACATALLPAAAGLSIVYTANGFDESSDARFAQRVIESGAEIVLLGLGSPQQEELALRLRDAGYRGTVWCVGALFEYYVPGERRHAPRWMRANGLEWLFRLSQEPRRLAKRYLWGNLLFLWRVLSRYGR